MAHLGLGSGFGQGTRVSQFFYLKSFLEGCQHHSAFPGLSQNILWSTYTCCWYSLPWLT